MNRTPSAGKSQTVEPAEIAASINAVALINARPNTDTHHLSLASRTELHLFVRDHHTLTSDQSFLPRNLTEHQSYCLAMEESISLEETNKIRISLGLKPLTDDKAPADNNEKTAEENYAQQREKEAKAKAAK